jgi:hypothetical protein
MDQQEELLELIYLIDTFRERYPSRNQNYGVHLETTRRIVETQLLELQRNEKHEQLQQIDILKQSVLGVPKLTRTDRPTLLHSVDPIMGSVYDAMHPGSRSPLDPELFIAQ